jgi:hypothetical protein
MVIKMKEETFENMKIRYQCGHCGCVYDAFIECQNCNTDDFIEKSFQCNFCNKIFSSSNHNCKKGETFESYLESHNFEITSNVRVYLKHLHDTEIKKYKSFIESEDLRHKFELKEKDKEIEKWKMLWQKTETERLKLQKEIDRRNEEDKLLGVL